MSIKDLDAKIEEIIRKQNEINQHIETLNDLVKNNQEESRSSVVWEPGENEPYHVVNTNGVVSTLFNNSVFDKNTMKHTRVFKTEEEAEFEVERMKVLRELEKFSCKFRYNERDWYIYYDYSLQKVRTCSSSFKCHELYFESEEMVKEAIKAVGEDRIKRYYLGVEDN